MAGQQILQLMRSTWCCAAGSAAQRVPPTTIAYLLRSSKYSQAYAPHFSTTFAPHWSLRYC